MFLHLKMYLFTNFCNAGIESMAFYMLHKHPTTKLCSKLHLIFKSIGHINFLAHSLFPSLELENHNCCRQPKPVPQPFSLNDTHTHTPQPCSSTGEPKTGPHSGLSLMDQHGKMQTARILRDQGQMWKAAALSGPLLFLPLKFCILYPKNISSYNPPWEPGAEPLPSCRTLPLASAQAGRGGSLGQISSHMKQNKTKPEREVSLNTASSWVCRLQRSPSATPKYASCAKAHFEQKPTEGRWVQSGPLPSHMRRGKS